MLSYTSNVGSGITCVYHDPQPTFSTVFPCRYCHQVVTPEVTAVAKELISTLMAFQKRHYQRDPTKARIRWECCYYLYYSSSINDSDK